MEQFEYEQLNPSMKKLFDDLKIEKTDKNATIIGNFMKDKSKELTQIIIDHIKEEFIEEG